MSRPRSQDALRQIEVPEALTLHLRDPLEKGRPLCRLWLMTDGGTATFDPILRVDSDVHFEPEVLASKPRGQRDRLDQLPVDLSSPEMSLAEWRDIADCESAGACAMEPGASPKQDEGEPV